jgi:thiol:disulfide interchange protein
MGVCVAVLGVTVAAGLLMRRAWARWLGVLAGVWLCGYSGNSFLESGGVFHLTVVLASAFVAVLLIIPATGRPLRDASAEASGPSVASRALFGGACAAMIGIVGVTAWAVVRAPSAPSASGVPGAPSKPAAASSGSKGDTARPATPVGALAWRDFADGLKEARSGKKLIVADFYATWCGPCKLMEKKTFHDPRVVTRLRDVVPVRVDAEETKARGGLKGVDLALRYSIEAYPTIVVVDGEGHELARNSGVMSPDEFLSWIDAVIERAGTRLARS